MGIATILLILLAIAFLVLVLGADITVTAANVLADTGFQYRDVTAGAAITAGQPVYLDSSDSNKAKLADANASQATAAAVGIALHAALAGQPLRVITGGKLAFGSGVLVKGTTYVVSATAGGIAPIADVASGWWVTHLGVAEDTSKLVMGLKATGIQV